MSSQMRPRSAAELLALFRSRGAVFSLVLPDRVVFDAPAGSLSDADLAALRAAKAELVELLRAEAEAPAVETNDSPAAPPAEPPTAQARDVLPPCYCCRGTKFWKSVHGVIVCGACHPPAVPELVAEWLEAAAPVPRRISPPFPLLVRGPQFGPKLVQRGIPGAATEFRDRGGNWQEIPARWRSQA